MRWKLVGWAAISAIAAACGGSSGGSTGGQAGVIHLYSINSLTGQSAPFGTPTDQAVRLEADRINQAGGLKDSCNNNYTFNVTSQDFANDKDQAVTLYRAAAGDSSVLAVIGPTSSVGYVAMEPIAGQLKLPIIGTGTGATVSQWNDYSYRVNVASTVAAPAMLKLLKSKLGFKRLGIIYDIQQDGYRTEAEQLKSISSKIGYDTVAFESFRTGDTDLSPQLTRIKAANPDLIAYEEPGQDLARAINQAAQLGLGNIPKVSGYDAFNAANIWDLTGGKSAGAYSWSAKAPGQSSDLQTWAATYKAKYNADPTVYAYYGHDAFAAVVDAVKRSCTGSDRAKFNSALRATKNVKGLVVDMTFVKGNGENQSAQTSVTQISGRGQETVISS